MVIQKLFLSALLATSVAAYSTTPSLSSSTRRDAFFRIATGTAGIFGTAVASPVHALEECPKNSQNCVRTAWTPPSGSTSKSSAVSNLREVLAAYPQQGQNGVDEGGWTIAEDNLDASGTARIEYRSSGKGLPAKLFNQGKPFVDDLKVEVEDNGTIQVRSASRIGESDLGVNTKRVDYLASAMKAKGWSV